MPVIRGDSANPNEGAVQGVSTANDQAMGVYGEAAHGSGVIGRSTAWYGVYGHSVSQHAVVGESDQGSGVVGLARKWIGVYGESAEYEGVRGLSKSADHGGVVALNEAGGAALYAKSANDAGVFDGNVVVTRRLTADGLDVGVSLRDLAGQVDALRGEVSRLRDEVAVLRKIRTDLDSQITKQREDHKVDFDNNLDLARRVKTLEEKVL
ncbi:hypothetical protein [Dactylosporangium sp. NPDC049140]|uniref:hypothetical protein n=1 Tax=Dactylosporangium sp. NPDC049140 TaxID=3155647 RepID=UPI00340513A3